MFIQFPHALRHGVTLGAVGPGGTKKCGIIRKEIRKVLIKEGNVKSPGKYCKIWEVVMKVV